MDNPALFVHVSLPSGIYRMPRAVAERAGLKPLGETSPPRSPAPKRRRRAAPKLREDSLAVTPESEPETSVSADTEEK